MTMVQVQSSIYITCGKLNINSALRGMLTSDNEGAHRGCRRFMVAQDIDR